MATSTGLPPQAYTRDILAQAFEWWSMQPLAIKERATTADAIVSYFLQARRRGAVNLDAPLSGEAFKADLKNLAEGLRQFEDNTVAPPPPLRSQAPVTLAPPAPVEEYQAPPLQLHQHQHVHQHHQPQSAAPPQPMPPLPPQVPGVVVWSVDARSLQAAREIQNRLNLGSEIEALRMLVTLGSERSREVFPPTS